MTGRFITLPPAGGGAAGHLPPARTTSSAPAALHPQPCPACKGQGFRITTHDGTRPACITCDGLGWLIREGDRP